MRPVLTILFATFAFATSVIAQERAQIGEGRLFNNDYFGDGRDRWQTGSYVFSHVRGRDDYTGQENFGDLIEYRFRAQIISPSGGTASPGDRRYAGALSVGAHTHFDYAGLQMSLGSDVVAVGPQTGLSRFQNQFHDAFGISAPLFTDQQIEDDIFLTATASARKTYHLSSNVTLRPFVEAQFGAEDMVRAGADMIIGSVGQNDLLLRDVVTGQLYRATEAADFGLSYVIGADIASVYGSRYLTDDMGYSVSETRARARAGVYWQLGEDVSFFYGATYLGEEFTTQTEGQIVGSLKLNFNF